MDNEDTIKNWLTSAVFEYSCKNDFIPVIKKILSDEELSAGLYKNLTCESDTREKTKPIFLLIVILKKLLLAVETFSSDDLTDFPWNSDGLPKILLLLERTYEKCEFISLKKYFSLVTQLKFLDLMHLLRSKVESPILMQRLNLHFPKWQVNHKANLERQFSIENPKILEKVEESCTQCRRLILKLLADPTCRNQYMSHQFTNDMKKMMIESSNYIKEVIQNISSNTGQTVLEKGFLHQQISCDTGDVGYQFLLDYLQPGASSETILRFLDDMDSVLAPPSGGFSSCLLPFDTLSECSEMDLDKDESGSESCSEESSGEKESSDEQGSTIPYAYNTDEE